MNRHGLRDDQFARIEQLLPGSSWIRRAQQRSRQSPVRRGCNLQISDGRSLARHADAVRRAWSKTRDFWRNLEKGLEGAFIPPPLAPFHQRSPIEWDRHWRSEVAKQPREERPEYAEKRNARFIQGDRPEDRAELAMSEGGRYHASCSIGV
jgi:hypothetical protein